MSLAPNVVVGASGQVLVLFDPVSAPGAIGIDRRGNAAAGRDTVFLALEGERPRSDARGTVSTLAAADVRRRRAWRKAGLCGSCGGAGLFVCGRCGSARYCRRDCQRADWGRHRPQCERRSGCP